MALGRVYGSMLWEGDLCNVHTWHQRSCTEHTLRAWVPHLSRSRGRFD